MSEKPQEDLLESIISKSIAQREEARAAAPEDAPAPPPEDQAPPPPPEDGKEAPSPNKRTAVYRYLLVLFGAAFILLLLAYFIQQRSSETAISDLRDSMNLSRAELMEEIDGLREENEQHKATIQELEEAEKAATDRWDALHQEFIALDDSHIETSLNLYRATALSFLERFCAGEDWLMAACVVEDSDKLFNRHDPENISIGHPPAAVEEWYFQLREQTLDEAGSLVVEQFRNKPEDENYTERVYILAENSRYGPEAVEAARKLWLILEQYCYRDYPAAAIELEKFCNSDPQYQEMLESGAFQPGTVELFQQVKDELKQSGLIAEDEDGKVTATVDSDSTDARDTLHGESGGEQADTLSLLTDELAALQEEYAKLEEALQSSESTGEELKSRHDILTAFAILEQALRDKNYETAVKYVQILAQENPDLGIMNQDGTAHFDNQARLAEIITLLEKQGVLEPGEVTISR